MSARRSGGGDGYQIWLVALTLLVPPLLVVPTLHLPFRLPKLLASELLGIASLWILAIGIWSLDRVPLAGVLRLPGVRAAGPLLLVATAGLLTTENAGHVRDAVWSLWIGTLCLVGWSLIDPARLRRTLDIMLIPAVGLSLLAVSQYHDLFRPFEFLAGEEVRRRGLTSAAGSVGDLGAYLVLPSLLAQAGVLRYFAAPPPRRRGKVRPGRPSMLVSIAALLVMLYTLAVIQTMAAVVSLGVSSLLLWTLTLRRRWLVAASGLLLIAAVVLMAPPLRQRAIDTVRSLESGRLNAALTGRLDGWAAALWMLEQRPLTGVGHGAYVAQFTPAKLALLERGAEFHRGQTATTFGNAHNEYLELAAELGLPGVLALLWLLFVLARCSSGWWRAAVTPTDRVEAALLWAVLLAFGLLALVYFPFRLALTAYPAVAVGARILAANRAGTEA